VCSVPLNVCAACVGGGGTQVETRKSSKNARAEAVLVCCVCAAVSQLLEAAGPNARVCRVMPNTPCLVGETAAAMCLGGKVCGLKGWVLCTDSACSQYADAMQDGLLCQPSSRVCHPALLLQTVCSTIKANSRQSAAQSSFFTGLPSCAAANSRQSAAQQGWTAQRCPLRNAVLAACRICTWGRMLLLLLSLCVGCGRPLHRAVTQNGNQTPNLTLSLCLPCTH